MRDEKRVEGVTCRSSRSLYYFTSFLIPFGFLYGTIDTWCFEPEHSYGLLYNYVHGILGAASILYLGMVIRCLFKDVPVPTHRIGAEGRRSWFLAMMIFMYCISYSVPTTAKLIVSLVALELIIAVISIVQLSWAPAEDFTADHILYTMDLGFAFAFLGGIGSTSSWSDFIASLLFFPLGFLFIIFHLDPPEQLDHDFQPADMV